MIQPLEQRRLLSFTLLEGTLTITGTAGNDVIRVTQFTSTQLKVEEPGGIRYFADSSVSRIVINGLDGADRLDVGAMDEPATLRGGNGNDTLVGGRGNDKLYGEANSDAISGNAGFDSIDGGSGNDFLRGGADTDTLLDGGGNDSVYGEGSPDFFRAGIGTDYYDAADDNLGGDTIDYSARTNPVFVSLDGVDNDGEAGELDKLLRFEGIIGGAAGDVLIGSNTVNRIEGRGGNDTISGLDGPDLIVGEGGDDSIRGNGGDDILVGNDGNDTITGLAGKDTVYGDAGNDVLSGGRGIDLLQGGDGNDVLVGEDGENGDLLFGDAGFDTAVIGEDAEFRVIGFEVVI